MADEKPVTPEDRLDKLERNMNRLIEIVTRDRDRGGDRRDDRDSRDRTVAGLDLETPRLRDMEKAAETLSWGLLRFRRRDNRDGRRDEFWD